MAEILSLDHVSVRYGGIEALKSVSLTVEEGSIVSLIGANGSGKSTLLKAIIGLEPIYSGMVYFRGEITARGKDAGKFLQTGADKMTAKKIGLVPEGRGVFSDMTVLENLEMGAYTRSNKAEFQANLERVFRSLPRLKERLKQLGGTLSGGEQQMLAIARALMAKPSLLLMDEPSMGLAPVLVEEVFNIIQDINSQGTSILLVEQNAQMALSVANRAYVLETGRIALEGDAHDVLQNPQVIEAYLGGH